MTVRVRLLGRPRLEAPGPPGGDAQPCPRPRGQKSWAVLARVALARRPPTRTELAAELFPDAEDPLGALRWCLADLRRALGLAGALRGDPIRLPDGLWVDVRALEDGDLPGADVGDALLEGIEPTNCPAWDSWLMLARARVAARSREELHRCALELLAAGGAEAAVRVAHRAVVLDPLDEDAHELFVRSLVAAGLFAQATVHLEQCSASFAREGLVLSPALRAAARRPERQPRTGVRAGVVARSLLHAGSAALSAGAVDAGVESLRRAVEEAARARDPSLEAEVLAALGSALVHAVRGHDGEGAVVLHRALTAARDAQRPQQVVEVLRELAFVDVQAGRHASAERGLQEAATAAGDDDVLLARVLALQGMNVADRGRHVLAADLLGDSAERAARAGSHRQQAWSIGVRARSLLLSGQLSPARQAAERSLELVDRERWNAFRPWPLALRAQALADQGDRAGAREDAEGAFALACELGDPCWEGMAARTLAVLAAGEGDRAGALAWTADGRRRCDRVPDRYLWVSAYIGLADVELRRGSPEAGTAVARLHRDAVRADLPEFLAWSLVHLAERGDPGQLPLAVAAADGVDNPALQARVAALTRTRGPARTTGPTGR